MEKQNSLNDAVKLYEVIGQYIPDIKDVDKDYVDFLKRIIDNIKDSGNYSVYFDAIEIMTGTTYNTLLSLSSEDVLKLFMNGLAEWRIIELVQFFRELGYYHDQPA